MSQRNGRSRSPCRLLVDPPAPGPWNMAVDEAILESAAEGGGLTWRFYRWDEPTLSLGYFQNHEDRDRHPPSRQCPMVRRATGGGAIVHDAEITYSLVVPAGHPLAARRLDLYHAVHRTLVETLASWGIHASVHEGADPSAETARRPFLCFLRRSPGDVLVDRVKIAGSAQRRSRGAVLQHGSVLIERSAAAPELEGVNAFAAAPVQEDELRQAWMSQIAERFSLAWEPSLLAEREQRRAVELETSQYASPQWNERKSGRGGRGEGGAP